MLTIFFADFFALALRLGYVNGTQFGWFVLPRRFVGALVFPPSHPPFFFPTTLIMLQYVFKIHPN